MRRLFVVDKSQIRGNWDESNPLRFSGTVHDRWLRREARAKSKRAAIYYSVSRTRTAVEGVGADRTMGDAVIRHSSPPISQSAGDETLNIESFLTGHSELSAKLEAALQLSETVNIPIRHSIGNEFPRYLRATRSTHCRQSAFAGKNTIVP